MLDSSRRLRQPFIDGVHDFVSKAMNQVSYISDGGVRLLNIGFNVSKSKWIA